jgi:hypothetical protein
VEEDGTGAVEADAGAGLDSLISSAHLVAPPGAGFSGEGGAPSMTPAERAARGTRARPKKHPKGRKATVQYDGMLCAGCSNPFVDGDFPPSVEGGHMVHARLTCSLALAARETARAAVVAKASPYAGMVCAGCSHPFVDGDTPPRVEGGQVLHARLTCALAFSARKAAGEAAAVAAPAMHSLAGDVGKPLPHRPMGSDRAGKPSTLRAAAAAATGFAGGSSTGPLLLRTRMAETVNGARMERIRDCLDGKCDPSQCRFAKTPCSTCCRGLHVAECGQFGTADRSRGTGCVVVRILPCSRDGRDARYL